jgi:AcrR family transcriptional regulator
MTQPKPLSRQERALRWRRDQVLDVAERVFARKGFHEATMQEIAREAEYATGTLYTIFDSKDALFAAVVERRLPQIAQHLRDAMMEATSPRERVERLVRAFFDFFGARKHLFQIYVHVTGGFLWNVKAELGEQVHEHHVAFVEFLEGAFREGIRTGEFRSTLDPRLAAVALVGILTAAATDWITRTPDESFEALRPAADELVSALFSRPTGGTARKGRPRSGKAR